MKHRIVVLLVFIFGYGAVCCAGVSGIGVPDTLKYKCGQERRVITQVLQKQTFDTFDLFYFIGNTDSSGYSAHKQKCHDFIGLQVKSGKDFSKAKNIKKLLRDIHSGFLTKYQLGSHFAHIFSKGEYNCLTSSALYAYILNSLGLEYTVKELPTHVYLAVKIDGKFQDVETTIPEDLLRITKEQKENYAKELVKNKIITQEELDEKGSTKVFDEQFYHSIDVNLVQLAGMAYQNSIAFLSDSSRYMEALDEIIISRNLYPRANINHFAALILNSLSAEPTRFGPVNVVKYSLVFSDQYDQEALAASIAQLGVNSLFRNGQVDSFLSIESYISLDIVRQDAKYYRIKETYHKVLGEYYQMKSEYAQSALHYRHSYQCNPADVQAPYQTKISLVRLFAQYLDSIQKLDDSALAFVSSFGFLESDKEFTDSYFEFLWKAFNNNMLLEVWSKDRLDSLTNRTLDKLKKLGRLRLTNENIRSLFGVLMNNYVVYIDYDKAAMVIKQAHELFPFNEDFTVLYNALTDPENYPEVFTPLYYELVRRQQEARNNSRSFSN